jgi:GAF domain-containing protein
MELVRYAILDTPPEERFDRITSLAAVLFDTPMASITLVDRDRQWFKARVGLNASQTPREESFCSHAIAWDDILVVADAREDDRFADNPLVTGPPHIRFYAGAPVRSARGANLGALCVISDQKRDHFSREEQDKLQMLAGIVESELELRLYTHLVQEAMACPNAGLIEAEARSRNSQDYTSALADLGVPDVTSEKVSALAVAAWTQYREAGAALSSAVTALRARMSTVEFRALIGEMPGFMNGSGRARHG